jgi:hypothetical protein
MEAGPRKGVEPARPAPREDPKAWVTRRVAITRLLPLIFLFYFGSLAIAGYLFPEPYDWRYRVISNLLSPRDNPQYYRIPSVGVALGAAFMLPLFGYIGQRMRRVSRWGAQTARWSLSIGAVLLMLAATIVPQHVYPVLGIRKLHEVLSHGSALFLGIGMLVCCGCAWGDRFAFPRRWRLDWRLGATWCSLTIGPIAGIGISRALLDLSWRWPEWGPVIRRIMHQSVFWHLGFWEWSGAAAVYLFLVAAVLWLPERVEGRNDVG